MMEEPLTFKIELPEVVMSRPPLVPRDHFSSEAEVVRFEDEDEDGEVV